MKHPLKMKHLFKKKVKDLDKMKVSEILENFEHCKAMNKSTILKAEKDGDESYWLNPYNQSCFESGWFSIDDFRDWAKGHGAIVKGDTPEQQHKFMEYDRLKKELDLSLFMYFEYLWMLKDDGKMLPPGTLMHSSDVDFIDKSKDDHEIVKDILSSFVPEFESELEYMSVENVKGRHRKMGWAVKKILSLLDYTQIGPCNKPCELYNIGWSWDLVFAKAYYLYCIKNDVKLPDIKFVQDNRYTSKGEFKK